MRDVVRAELARTIRRMAAGFGQLLARRVTVSLADIAVGLTTVPITWTPPINGGYTAVVTVIAGAADLPKLVVGVKAGSKAPAGCDILVVNVAALAISAAGLDIIIVPASS